MARQRYKVLLVDDEVDLLRLWRLRLESKGYEVAVAKSGEEALATFTTFKPEVVLTDLRMPGIDGLALFEAVRRQNKAVPVIIITAHGSIPEAVEATRQGVFSFLTKPIEGADLLREVEKALQASGGAAGEMEDREEWRQDIICRSAVMEELLSRARSAVGGPLTRAEPLTEAVTKGGRTVVRARFAGFADEKTATQVCNTLKKKSFSCFPLRL